MNFYPFNHDGLVLKENNKGVLRVRGQHLCGYVALPINEVPESWKGNYDADALQYLAIHGGLTYCECQPKENPTHVVFGFDCAHAGDEENPNLQDCNHVMKLTNQMEEQLKKYAAKIEQWRKAGKEERCNIIQEITDSAEIKVEMGFGAMLDLLTGGLSLSE